MSASAWSTSVAVAALSLGVADSVVCTEVAVDLEGVAERSCPNAMPPRAAKTSQLVNEGIIGCGSVSCCSLQYGQIEVVLSMIEYRAPGA